MRHIDVFLLLTLHKRNIGLTDEDVQSIISRRNISEREITTEDIRMIMMHPPSEKHMIHALLEIGYQPKFIAEYLKMTPGAVSYHVKNPPKKEYVNPWLKIHIEGWKNTIATNIYMTGYWE